MIGVRRLRTVACDLDQWLYRGSSLVFWAGAIIAGLLLLFCSGFVGIDQFTVPGTLAENKAVAAISKQLGIWSALNWPVIYLVLFPLFLVCSSRQASQIRNMIADLTDFRVFVFSDGRIVDRAYVSHLLDGELQRASPTFVFLIFAVIVVSLGGWVMACAIPLFNFELSGQVVDWSTGAIVLGWRSLKYPLLVYTFIAYAWMGFALFVYLSCLFLGYVHSSFLHKFAAGQYEIETARSRLLSREALSIALRGIAYNFFVACFLGLVAAFFMRLEVAYLISDKTSIIDYWFQNLKIWNRIDNWHLGLLAEDAGWQPLGTQNQTLLTSGAVVAATLVSLAGTLWLLGATLKAARLYTLQCKTDLHLLERYGLSITVEDEATLKSDDVLSPIFPGYRTSFTLALAIVLCTLLPKLTLIFSATILVAIIRYLRRFFKNRGNLRA